MSATFSNDGLQVFLKNIMNVTGASTLLFDLYTNNFTPLVTSVLGDFTVCTLSGYAQLSMTPGSWAFSGVAGVGSALFPSSTFTFDPYGGGTTIYGYVISAGGIYLAAELYGSPYAVPAGGGALTVGPSSTLRKLP